MATVTQKSVLESVPTGLLIGGQWRDASGGKTLAVDDPATGEVLTHVADASVADGKAALDAAVAAQADWARTAPRDRAELLRAAYEKITERADEFAHAHDPRDGQDARRVAGRGRLRRRVLPLVLRGGRAHRRSLRRRPQRRHRAS